LRSEKALPQAAFLKTTLLAACLIVFLAGSVAAEPSREIGGPHPGRQRSHPSVELSKVRRAAVSARAQVRSVAAKAKGKHAAKSAARASRGQQVISSERASQIQSALIREHYLDGEATGVWDQRTKDALIRYQNENGWQTKVIPDSRALIKLGLGPRNDGLLNPDSAALASPHELGAEHEIPGGR